MALNEGVLLGRALLGQDPAALERVILVQEAWAAAALPEDGVTVHVTTRRAGRVVHEEYLSADGAGGGRRHGGVGTSAPAGDVRALAIDEGATPARDRFTRLHSYLAEQLREARAVEAQGGRPPDPSALRQAAFIDNVAAALPLGPTDSPHPLLTAISRELWTRLSAAPPPEPPRLAETARELEDLALTGRRHGQLAGLPAAALLLAARLPMAVANAAPLVRRVVELARHLSFSVLELGVSTWQALYGPAHKALREGYRDAVVAVAQDLLAAAERHRELALDGPLDRDHFSEQLFVALPYALAAMHLGRFVVAAEPSVDDPIRLQASVAEEVVVRLQDGLVHQWLDVDDSRFQADRRRISEAVRRGDALAVQLLLREGELSLSRPRAARGLLLGEGTGTGNTDATHR